MNIRDSLDFCNICETDFECTEQVFGEGSELVVLTTDGRIIEKSRVEDGYTAVFDVEDEPYRGVYCQSCWDELMELEHKLWKEKYDKRGTTRLVLFTTDTVSTKKSRSNE